MTRFEDFFPRRCEKCRAGLHRVSEGDPLRHQTVDIPEIKAQVIERRWHAVRCGACDHVSRVQPRHHRLMCGPNIIAIMTLLVGVYHVSRRQAVSFVGDVLGVDLSLGLLSKVEGRVSEMLAPAHAEASHAVDRARAKHADATGWRQSGANRTLWVLASKVATVFHIVQDGTRDSFRALLGTLSGILITDRGSQFLFWAMERRQICWAHLLRRFAAFSESPDERSAELGRTLVLLTQVLFHAWHRIRDGTPADFQRFVQNFRVVFEGHLERGAELRLEGVSGSCKDILAHRDALWTFASAPGVGPTNNHAERELRAFVLWRKMSFGSQSDRGDRFAERIMTVVHTLRKQERHVLSFLRDTVTASLRRQPTPHLFLAPP